MYKKLHAHIHLHQKSAGILLAITGFAFLAFGDTSYKFVSLSYPTLVTGFYSALSTLACALIAASLDGGLRQKLATKKPKLHLLRAALMCLTFFLFVQGLKGTTLASAYTIDALGPMIAALISFLILGEKLTIARLCCIAGGFAGVLIVLRPGLIPINVYSLCILFQTLTFALANVINRKIGEHESPLTFTLYWLLVSLTVQSAYTLSLGWLVPKTLDLLVMLLGGIFSFVGMICCAKAFSIIDTAVAAKFQYTQLLWGVLLGFLLFKDVPDAWTMGGAAIIISCAMVMIYLERTPQKVIENISHHIEIT